jgi:phage-related protein
MPLLLSSTVIQEKNKIGGGAVTLVAIEIIVPGLVEHIRIISDSVDLEWRGETWVALNFEIEDITDDAKGSIPQVDLRIANKADIMRTYIKAYDTYNKAYGFSPIEIHVFVVNKAVLDAYVDEDPYDEYTDLTGGWGEPIVEYIFDLKQPKIDKRWATFTMGAPNYYSRRYPLNRILKNFCRYPFKGERCGYIGDAYDEYGKLITCNHSLARCRELGNSTRFGNAPGVGKGGITVD